MDSLIHLDFLSVKKQVSTAAVVKCLKHISQVSNSNLVCNADLLLSSRTVETPVDWTGESKMKVSPQKFKVSY